MFLHVWVLKILITSHEILSSWCHKTLLLVSMSERSHLCQAELCVEGGGVHIQVKRNRLGLCTAEHKQTHRGQKHTFPSVCCHVLSVKQKHSKPPWHHGGSSDSVPVRPSVVVSHGVTPGDQSQRQDNTGPSRQEEHTHTQHHRQEGRKQGAERAEIHIAHVRQLVIQIKTSTKRFMLAHWADILVHTSCRQTD